MLIKKIFSRKGENMKTKEMKKIVTRIAAGVLILAMVFPSLSSISFAAETDSAEESVATETESVSDEEKEESVDKVPVTEPADDSEGGEESGNEEKQFVNYYVKKYLQSGYPNLDGSKYDEGEWELCQAWGKIGEEYTVNADSVNGFYCPEGQTITLNENADMNRVTFYYEGIYSYISLHSSIDNDNDLDYLGYITYGGSYEFVPDEYIPFGYELDYLTLDGEKVDGNSVTIYGDGEDHRIDIILKAITYGEENKRLVKYYVRYIYQLENSDYEHLAYSEEKTYYATPGDTVTVEASEEAGYITPESQSFVISESEKYNHFELFYEKDGSFFVLDTDDHSYSTCSWRIAVANGETYSFDSTSYGFYPGYELDYLTLDEEKVDGGTIVLYGDDKDHTIEIKSKPKTYTITYEGCEDVENLDMVTTYTIEDNITIQNPRKDGYTFLGWNVKGSDGIYRSMFLSKNLTLPLDNIGFYYSEGDVILEANWAKNDEVTYVVYTYFENIDTTEYEPDVLPRIYTTTVGEEIELIPLYNSCYEYPEIVIVSEDEPGVYTYNYYLDRIHLSITALADEGVTVSGGGEFYAGQTTTLSAVVADGYEFTGWKLWTEYTSWTESQQTFEKLVEGRVNTFALATARRIASDVTVNFNEFKLNQDEVTITKSEYSTSSDAAADAIEALKENDIVLAESSSYHVFDVSMTDEDGNAITDEFGKLTLTFPVDKSDNGKTATIYHIHEGKVVNTVQDTVKDGTVGIQVSQLSTFVVVIDETTEKKTETPAKEEAETKVEEKTNSTNTSASSTTPISNAAASATQAQSSDAANTGDHNNLLLWAVLASFGLAASAVAVWRYKKKIR
jgi:hypothetical protein